MKKIMFIAAMVLLTGCESGEQRSARERIEDGKFAPVAKVGAGEHMEVFEFTDPRDQCRYLIAQYSTGLAMSKASCPEKPSGPLS